MQMRAHANSTWIVLLAAAVFANVLPVSAESITLFRVFLKDGTSVVSYGEYARAGQRLVFSMPLGPAGEAREPRLHLVNLPISAVDWPATTEYADSVRYTHYIRTRAEADYAVLAGDIAASQIGMRALIASDISAHLGAAFVAVGGDAEKPY